jgi:protein-tyrosine phosphatase
MKKFFGKSDSEPDEREMMDFSVLNEDGVPLDEDLDISLDDLSLDDLTIIGGDSPLADFHFHSSPRKALNFNRITQQIFLGSCPATKDDVDRLKKAGVTMVINLQTDNDILRKQIDWDELTKHYDAAGIQYRHIPTVDYDELDLRKKIPLGLLWMDTYIQQGHVVYVHCNSGINRSPTLVCAYLHLQGATLMSAVNHVLKCRPCWPDKVAIATGCRVYRWNQHKIMLSEEQKKKILEKLHLDDLAGIPRSKFDSFEGDVDTFIARCREVLIEQIEDGRL